MASSVKAGGNNSISIFLKSFNFEQAASTNATLDTNPSEGLLAFALLLISPSPTIAQKFRVHFTIIGFHELDNLDNRFQKRLTVFRCSLIASGTLFDWF